MPGSPSPTPVRANMPRGILPEGLVWDSRAERLSWVDIELGLLHTAGLEDGIVRLRSTWELPDQVGCALPVAGGGWICGVGRSLAMVSPRGAVEVGPALLRESERFNDGHVDSQGRVVIGTLDSDGAASGQLLLRIETDGSITTIDDGIGVSNGIAWSPDGAWLYHADTARRVVTRRAYGDRVGVAEDHIVVDGMPDGIAVDAEGDVWVTVFDAGRIDRYGADGARRADQSIVFPGAHVASVAFGGPDLDVLLVATGMPIMRRWLARRRREDGWVFALPSPVRGLAGHEAQPTSLPTWLRR